MQIKTLLCDKEQLKESLDTRVAEVDEIQERSKMHELQVSKLVE